MAAPLTSEDKDLLLAMWSTGMAIGLDHPYQWYDNIVRMMPSFLPYDDIPEQERRMAIAFIKQMRRTGSHPDDPIETVDVDKLYQIINDWYDSKTPDDNTEGP